MGGPYSVPGGVPFVPGVYDSGPGTARIADLILRQGDIEANRQARSGEILGSMFQNLGQQAGQAIREHQQRSDQDKVGQAITAATSANYPSAAPGPLQMPSNDYLGQLGSGPVAADPGSNHVDSILASLPGHLRPAVQKGIDDFNRAADVADERKARLQEIQQNAERAKQEYAQSVLDAQGSLAHHALKNNLFDGPDGGIGTTQTIIGLAKGRGLPGSDAADAQVAHAQQIMQAAQQSGDPANVQAAQASVSASMKALAQRVEAGISEKQRVQLQSEDAPISVAKDTKLVEKGTYKTLVDNQAPDSRSLQVQRADAIARGDTATADNLLKQMKDNAAAGAEGRVTVNLNQPNSLDPDGIEYAATQYRITGKMPALGMGNAAAKAAIINGAAKQAKDLGQTPAASIQRQAAYSGDSKALAKMQTMSAAASSFEQKALGQADIVSQLSDKVNRSQYPLINQAILSGKAAFGDKDTQLLYNSISTFAAEYAKIMEGSTGSASGSSDSARRASDRLINAKLNNGTLQATLELMKKEMRLTIGGYDATIGHITDRMGGTMPTTGGGPAADPLGILK